MEPATIASLINFGSAGAVIIVVIIFLNYIGKRDVEWRDFFTLLNKNNVEDMGRLTKAIDQMAQSLDKLGVNLKMHDDHVEQRIKDVQTATRRRTKAKEAGQSD
jgi:nitrate/nitrite-specific signal transduction histidine kinase